MYQRFDALFPPPPPLSRWGLRLSPLMASLGPYIIDLQTRIGWRNFCVYFTTAPTVHEICQIYPWQEFNYWLSPNKVLRAPFSFGDDVFRSKLIILVPSWFRALPLSLRARDKYQVTAWNNIFSDNEIFPQTSYYDYCNTGLTKRFACNKRIYQNLLQV